MRPSNAYGPGQRPFVGATAMASVMRGMPIKIFRQHGAIRDYLYVSDLASGLVSALTQGHLSETYNLWSGVGLLKPLMHEIGYEVQVENLPERAFDVRANVLDSATLRIDTGWKPAIGFEEGLIITRDWFARPLT